MKNITKTYSIYYQVLHFTFQITLVLSLITTFNAKAEEAIFFKPGNLIAQTTKKKFDTGQNPKEEITKALTDRKTQLQGAAMQSLRKKANVIDSRRFNRLRISIED